MVGIVEDVRKLLTQGFKAEGDLIALLGETKDDLAASGFAQTVLGLSTAALIENGILPEIDLDFEKRVQETLLKLADAALLKSAHDCSDGGLAVTIAESCFSSLGRDAIGAEVELNSNGLSPGALLFRESPSRIVISFSPDNLEKVTAAAGDCPLEVIGKVTDDVLKINIDGEEQISESILDLEVLWETSLEKQLAA